MDELDDMILPEVKTVKGKIRKYKIDENGKSYEVEEEIDIPVFDSASINDTKEEKE